MTVNRAVLGCVIAALFVSLMGNIFVGGIVFGHAVKPLPTAPELVSLGPILKSLPEGDRRLMRRNFALRKDDIQAAATAARTSAGALRDALGAEDLDIDRLNAAIADYRQNFYALRTLEQDLFWDSAEHFSPQGRQKLANSAAFDRALK